MLFNSLTFVLFFGAVLGIYHLPLSWRAKKVHLLISSYVFYAAWNPPFVLLLMLSTVVDWLVARQLSRTQTVPLRRLLLIATLVMNFGVLGFFKYGGFLLDAFVTVATSLGIHYQPPGFDIVLPVGISFYTFQTLSYTIDVYRRDLKPVSSLLDFALFVTFFPQLVAGPIVRASDFLPQLGTPKRATSDQFSWGLSLVTMGLFQKVILADHLTRPTADLVYGAAARAGALDAWLGTLAFSAQIFFDFAGYSTCAIGAAMCFGFVLTDNFRSPYAAIGFSDFWRRWHISLSTWLRDYLYIPLGGNRRGEARTHANLMITMLLGGLWHGAAWRFVAWGGLHGIFLVGERWLRTWVGDRAWVRRGAMQVGLAGVTYALVCVTWVFFRAPSFGDAFVMLQALVGLRPDTLGVGLSNAAFVLGVTAAMLAWHAVARQRTVESIWGRFPAAARGVLLAVLLSSIFLSPGREDYAFIYFQF